MKHLFHQPPDDQKAKANSPVSSVFPKIQRVIVLKGLFVQPLREIGDWGDPQSRWSSPSCVFYVDRSFFNIGNAPLACDNIRFFRMFRPMRLFAFILTVCTALNVGFASAADDKPDPNETDNFIRTRLIDAVLLFDRHFRVAESGQYLDAIRIGDDDQSHIASSIAATGIGLISLAIGDALGVVDNAEEKAAKTLSNLLNRDKTSGFKITRSPSGWYPHFIHPKIGTRHKKTELKFSTIDTSLLAAGAAIAARYFNAKSYTRGEGESRVFQLANDLIDGVKWSSAIKNADRGLIHLIFIGQREKQSRKVFATPFDEYALIACISMRGEQRARKRGVAHDLYFKHYEDVRTLPTNEYEGHWVIGKRNGSTISHFTHLFVFYYCNSFNGQQAYRSSLRELAAADRKHFAKKNSGSAPKTLWGLGAGSEIKFKENGEVNFSGYGVNNLNKNPFDTASPAIMTGLAPVFKSGEKSDPLSDLQHLWHSNTCRYHHQGLGFLWRCSVRDTSIKVKRVEAVDFSTYLLGLAGRDRKLGMAFFRNFNL